MTTRLKLRAYGRTVELTGPRDSLSAAAAQLPPTFVEAPNNTAEATWQVDAEEPRRVLSELELWVAEHAEGYIFVHAGCVAVAGNAILLPGYTMSGKSSLTAALIRVGAEYLSDEYAVLDRDGQVHPYVRPLSIRNSPGKPALRIAATSLGANVASAPARVAIVATLRYHPGSHALDAVRVGRGQAILDLLANTVPARSRPRESLEAAESATAGAIALRGPRGEADAAATELLTLLAGTCTDNGA